MAKLDDLLKRLRACDDAREWAKGKSLRKAWETCERADWMLWLLLRMEGRTGWPDRKGIVLLACDCAETALKFVTKGEERPRIAIETARRWANGQANIGEVGEASSAAYAASSAASSAAYAAAYADATAAAAADATAAYAAKTSALREMASLIRKRVPKLPRLGGSDG